MSAVWQARASILAEGLAGGYLIALLVACIQAMEVVTKGRTDALQLPMTFALQRHSIAVSVMLIHWMRRNVAGASLQTAMLKLGDRGGLFLHRLCSGWKIRAMPGWLRLPILVLALFGPMLIGVPVALSLD